MISYRQVIAAFPGGGGAYAVAKRHLGTQWSLLAAASLIVDYILNAAVGVSAGIEALTSAFPGLYGGRVWLCLAALALITGGEPVGGRRIRPAVHRADRRVHRGDGGGHRRGLLRSHPAVPPSTACPAWPRRWACC